jgi:hypothetical protein
MITGKVMHLPESVLCTCRFCRFGSVMGVGAQDGTREVAKGIPQSIPEDGEKLLHHGTGLVALGACVVAV